MLSPRTMILGFLKFSMILRAKSTVAGLCVVLASVLQQSAAAEECEDGADGVPQLSSRTGWLVLDIAAERRVGSLAFRRAGRRWDHRLEPVEPGRTFEVVEIRGGDYQWSEISLPHYDLPFRRVVADDERWRFRVERGAVNYIGQIIVNERRGTDYVDVRLVNRIAADYPELQQRLEPYLKCYPLVYSGAVRDDFLEEYKKLLPEDNNGHVE